MMKSKMVRSGQFAWPDKRWMIAGAMALLLTIGTGLSAFVPAQASPCTNILANGSFESSGGWNAQTSGAYPLTSNYLVQNGSQSAHLGGINNATDRLSTAITLPNAPSLTFRMWWLIESEEGSSNYDGLNVVVADANGAPVQTLLTLSGNTSAWQQASADLSHLAGQTIQLQFLAQTDGTLVSDFFVDNVELTACDVNQNNWQFLPFTVR
jgi:hypothetical protein